MSEFVFINRLQPKEGQRGQLIDLLREFATVIHKEPGGVHYSLHQPTDDETGPLTVIQVFSSVAAFEEHGAWMGPNVPRLLPLLASPPEPPVLLEQISLAGNPRESFSAVPPQGN
jgi:quinol monooxygenase YgiN